MNRGSFRAAEGPSGMDCHLVGRDAIDACFSSMLSTQLLSLMLIDISKAMWRQCETNVCIQCGDNVRRMCAYNVETM